MFSRFLVIAAFSVTFMEMNVYENVFPKSSFLLGLFFPDICPNRAK